MMKSGSLPGALTLGPQAQEKVIAAIKSGGKTVEELTDFCKTLSKKEELGELSSVSEENESDTDSEIQFHHPFLIKERPISITMNIKVTQLERTLLYNSILFLEFLEFDTVADKKLARESFGIEDSVSSEQWPAAQKDGE